MAKIFYFCVCIVLYFQTQSCFSLNHSDVNIGQLVNVSKICKKHLNLYTNGLLNQEMWAMQMFDATAKSHAGILRKNIYNLGHFSECLSIEADLSEDTIYGKYCLGNVHNALHLFPSTLYQTTAENVSLRLDVQSKLGLTAMPPLKWGVCVPATCNANELNEFVLKLIGVNVSFAEDMCQTRNSIQEPNFGAILTKLLFVAILCLVLISTVYHLYLESTERESANGILMAFSALANGRKIMRTNINTGDRLECLDGIKSIAMMGVIMGHDFYIRVYGPLVIDSCRWSKKILAAHVLLDSFSVDTFFVVAGVLTSYRILKAAKQGKNFSIFAYYSHRYLSFLPGMIAIILIHTTMMKDASSGPLYPKIMENVMIRPCQKYWWSTLLFIQNYVNTLTPCLAPSWYLAVDFQICLISPLFLIPLIKNPKLAFKIMGALSTISVAIGFVVYYKYKLLIVHTPRGIMDVSVTRNNYFKYFYTPFYTRMSPYLIGIMLGYLIFQLKQQNGGVQIKKPLLTLLWLLYLVITIGSLTIGEFLHTSKYNRLSTSLYGCLIRPVWALTLSWVIFACTFNYGGFLGKFLSLPTFKIISKLAYSLFLVHFPIIMIKYLSSETPYTFTLFDFIITNGGLFVFIMTASLLWSLIIEYPFNNIVKYLFTKNRNEEKSNCGKKES